VVAAAVPLRPVAPGLSPSQERRAVEVFNAVDGYAGLRNGLARIAGDRDEWAGIPMPLDGQQLVIEPTYPMGKELAEMTAAAEPDQEGADKLRNTFWSWKKRGEIMIGEVDGKIEWGIVPGVNHFRHDLQTLGCADAWGIEQEHRAVQLLGTLLRHRNFKQYLLTGMFLETSKRSGVTYMFRRLKPTIAMTMRPGILLSGAKSDNVRILCALCMHPIAYYSGSWAGAMTPTDDMVAALMMMRGDEHMFWRRANQHPPYRPEAGL
jgi:hypothetical protein